MNVEPLILDLPDDLTAEVNEAAAREGITFNAFAVAALRRAVSPNGNGTERKRPDYSGITERVRARRANMTEEEREREGVALEAAAERLAPLYAADRALPPHLRELTAFEVLNDYDPILEPHEYMHLEGESAVANY